MPRQSAFNPVQARILRETAERIGKDKRRFKTQEKFALALGVSQQTVSNLFLGTYTPSEEVAQHIANLDGKTLVDLVGDYGAPAKVTPKKTKPGHALSPFPNLETCIQFYSGERQWSSWTVAAARAGVWGEKDLAPPAWPEKLDAIEQALGSLRKLKMAR